MDASEINTSTIEDRRRYIKERLRFIHAREEKYLQKNSKMHLLIPLRKLLQQSTLQKRLRQCLERLLIPLSRLQYIQRPVMS